MVDERGGESFAREIGHDDRSCLYHLLVAESRGTSPVRIGDPPCAPPRDRFHEQNAASSSPRPAFFPADRRTRAFPQAPFDETPRRRDGSAVMSRSTPASPSTCATSRGRSALRRLRAAPSSVACPQRRNLLRRNDASLNHHQPRAAEERAVRKSLESRSSVPCS